MPAEVWAQLEAGNQRFIDGTPLHPRQDAERRSETSGAQHPMVAIFGCSDSRLAAEIIFDVGLGDAFVVRNAGQVISDSVVGSLEYAVGVLGVHMIVVLGHDKCGAVLAAIASQAPDADPLPPNIQLVIDRIIPAVHRVAGGAEAAKTAAATLDDLAVGREHLHDTISELLQRSELISDAIAAGTLAIVGANYRLGEGKVAPDLVVGQI